MESIWAKDCRAKAFEPLRHNITTDVLVIGAGMAGVLCAYELKKRGVRTVVIESGRVGGGQTKNTTAKITAQHGVIYKKLLKNFGAEYARLYGQANCAAIEKYASIIKENQIDCAFERRPAVLYSTHSIDTIKEETRAAIKAGIPCRLTDETKLPFPVKAALLFENQAQFNPMQFLSAIAPKLDIYEHTYAFSVSGNTVYTNGGVIRCRHVIFACHYPFVNFPGLYFLKMSQKRSYAVAAKTAFQGQGMYFSADKGALSVRSYRELTLFTDETHRTGKAPAQNAFEAVKKTAQAQFGAFDECYRWSAQDCMTPDNVPYIGRFSKYQKNWLVATGFNKWGMSTSAVAADILADIVCGAKNEYEKVFTPQRFNLPAAAANMAVHFCATVSGFAGRVYPALPRFGSIKMECGMAKEVIYKGQRAGAYCDSGGNVHIVSLKCPHLGSALKWNETTKTWDCPCHGSAFDYKGNLISNPAENVSIHIATIAAKKE